jgi:hypothetical protein
VVCKYARFQRRRDQATAGAFSDDRSHYAKRRVQNSSVALVFLNNGSESAFVEDRRAVHSVVCSLDTDNWSTHMSDFDLAARIGQGLLAVAATGVSMLVLQLALLA